MFARMICDMHFESNVLSEVTLAKMLQDNFKIKRLPFFDIAKLHNSNPQLAGEPTHEAVKDDCRLLVGDKSLGMAINTGEINIDDKIALLTQFVDKDSKVKRLGVRATLKEDFQFSALKIFIHDKKQDFDTCIFEFSKEYKDYSVRLAIINNKLDIVVFKKADILHKDIKERMIFLIEKVKGVCDELKH